MTLDENSLFSVVSISLNLYSLISLSSLLYQCQCHLIKDDKIFLTNLAPNLTCSLSTQVFPSLNRGWETLMIWFQLIPLSSLLLILQNLEPKTKKNILNLLCTNFTTINLQTWSLYNECMWSVSFQQHNKY